MMELRTLRNYTEAPDLDDLHCTRIDWGRVGLGVITGGASELVRKDPFGIGNEGVGGIVGTGLVGDAGSIDPNSVHKPALPPQLTDPHGGVQTSIDRNLGLGDELTANARWRLRHGREAPTAQAAQGDGPAIIGRGGLNFALRRDLDTATQQSDFANRDLLDAARGNAPSAAEIQQRRGVQDAIKAQQAAANSARGGGAAAIQAQRAAAQQGATLAAESVQDAAQLRAGEQATARAQLVNALGQERAQTLQRASLESDVAQAQARLDQQAMLQDLANRQQAAMLNPQLELRSRALDDTQAKDLFGLGLQANQFGGQLTLGQARAIMDHEQFLTNRDLNIVFGNADVETKRTAAGLGALRDFASVLTGGLA